MEKPSLPFIPFEILTIHSAFYGPGYPEKEEERNTLTQDINKTFNDFGVGGILVGLVVFCGVLSNVVKMSKLELAVSSIVEKNYRQLSKALHRFIDKQEKKWQAVPEPKEKQ